MKIKPNSRIRGLTLLLAFALIAGTGCGERKTRIEGSANEAIAMSKSFMNDRERLDYLIIQIKGFIAQNQELEAGFILEEAMKIDKWNTKELDALARQLSASIKKEGVLTDRAKELPQYGL